jgi:hypothetical protein
MEKKTWCGLNPGDHVLYVIKKDGTKIRTEVSPYGLLNVPLAFYLSSFAVPSKGPVASEFTSELSKVSRLGRVSSQEKEEAKKLLKMLSSDDVEEIFVERVKPY